MNPGSSATSCITLSGSRTFTLTAPFTTCAAVKTVRPATMHPDPYRYGGCAASPRSAITSTTRAASGNPDNGYPFRTSEAEAIFTGFPSRSTGPPNTTVTFCSDPRSRAPPPPSCRFTTGTANPALPSTDLVAVTVNSTVIDSTGSWISESAPAARALSSSSRSNPIACASPSPSADAASTSDIHAPSKNPAIAIREPSVTTRPPDRRYPSSFTHKGAPGQAADSYQPKNHMTTMHRITVQGS